MSFPGSNWMNEDGEPYMTAAELRFEAELDAQSAEERLLDDFYDDYGSEPDFDDEDDDFSDEDDFDPMEDQWLDGSYED